MSSNVPSLQVRPASFRSATNSANQNKMEEELLYDLNNLFNLVNQQEAELNNAKQVLGTENQYQTIRIANLEKELQEIQNLYNQLQAGTGRYKKQAYVDSFSEDTYANEQEKAEVDTYHSLLTLPIKGKVQSKIYLYDEIADEIVLPKSLKAVIEPAADGMNIIDNDITNAFRNSNEIWARRYVYGLEDAVDSVTTEITITLPDNIISNRDINTLTFHPFPLSTVNIDKIEYRMEGGWNLIPGFPQDDVGAPVPIKDAKNMKFSFEALAMAEVRITLTQENFIVENHKKVFYVGASEIGVSYTDYQSSIGRFICTMTLDGQATSKLIKNVIPHFKNGEALSDKTTEKRSIFNYAIYTLDANGVMQYTRDTLPVMVGDDVIVIKANINADPKTGAAPTLESIEVQYEDLV